MKTEKRWSKTIVLGLIATMAAAQAQANPFKHLERLLDHAGRTLTQQHDAVVAQHERAAKAVARAPVIPLPPVIISPPAPAVRATVQVRSCPPPPPLRQPARVQVRVWVPGYYTEEVETVWVPHDKPYRHEPGCRCYGCQGGHYENVIVQRWVPGHYEYRWVETANHQFSHRDHPRRRADVHHSPHRRCP